MTRQNLLPSFDSLFLVAALYKHRCSQCARAFKYPSELKRHEFIHNETKPYICQFDGWFEPIPLICLPLLHSRPVYRSVQFRSPCAGQFTPRSVRSCLISSDLTRSRPFFSHNVSGKRFAQLTTLNNHLRTHTNERPFACPLCEAKFKQRFVSLYLSRPGHLTSDRVMSDPAKLK